MVMDRKQITASIRAILDRADIETDGLVNRKVSPKHNDEIEVLLEHVRLLVADLKFDVAVSRRELFEVRAVLEENRGDIG